MPYNASGQWVYEDDGVANRVAAITSKDSPLMTAARGIGLGVANRRGLVNSSMAAGAATNAALSSAVPIASQEAQQTYGKNVQQMGTNTQMQVTAAQLAEAERERIATSISQASGDYTSGIGATLQNDKIPADARAAAQSSARDILNSQIAALQNLYGVNLNWGAIAPAPRPAAGAIA